MTTPTYTPVTAAATTSDGVWPGYGVLPEVGSGVLSSETLPIVQQESQEPLETEDSQLLFQEG